VLSKISEWVTERSCQVQADNWDTMNSAAFVMLLFHRPKPTNSRIHMFDLTSFLLTRHKLKLLLMRFSWQTVMKPNSVHRYSSYLIENSVLPLLDELVNVAWFLETAETQLLPNKSNTAKFIKKNNVCFTPIWIRSTYSLYNFNQCNWFFFHIALQPNAGYGLLIHEVLEITHTTRHSR
jgi:hypothetical protein